MHTEEKRSLPRFPLEIPLWLKIPESDATVHGRTRDVSANGVFFYINCTLQEHSQLEFTMTLPPELTRTAAIQVCCKATVLRVQEDIGSGKIGVAASIQGYDFLGM